MNNIIINDLVNKYLTTTNKKELNNIYIDLQQHYLILINFFINKLNIPTHLYNEFKDFFNYYLILSLSTYTPSKSSFTTYFYRYYIINIPNLWFKQYGYLKYTPYINSDFLTDDFIMESDFHLDLLKILSEPQLTAYKLNLKKNISNSTLFKSSKEIVVNYIKSIT